MWYTINADAGTVNQSVMPSSLGGRLDLAGRASTLAGLSRQISKESEVTCITTCGNPIYFSLIVHLNLEISPLSKLTLGKDKVE